MLLDVGGRQLLDLAVDARIELIAEHLAVGFAASIKVSSLEGLEDHLSCSCFSLLVTVLVLCAGEAHGRQVEVRVGRALKGRYDEAVQIE